MRLGKCEQAGSADVGKGAAESFAEEERGREGTQRLLRRGRRKLPRRARCTQGTEGGLLAGADTFAECPQPGTINSGLMYNFWHQSLGDFDTL